MADVLSQNEVESLLAALEPTSNSGGQPQSAQAPRQPRREIAGQITVYDFKRPERVSKEQMRAFQALHDGFSRELGASISGMLRSIVEVKLISVDQLTYSEFVFSLENPTCFNLLNSRGLDGHLILDLNPSIIFPIVDRLLGGGKTSDHSFPSRPLTEIELRLVSRITKLAIESLENAWRNICSLELEVSQVESNPQLVQIVPPNEVVVLISFEIAIGEISGLMNLCIPFNTIEPLSSKLSSDTWSTYAKKQGDDSQKRSLEMKVKTAEVGVVASLAETKLKTSELAGLNIGDVIVTENDVSNGVTLYVEGRPMFRGHPGTLKGHLALEIIDRLNGHKDAEPDEQPPAEANAENPAPISET